MRLTGDQPMKRIADERARIDAYKRSVRTCTFFNDRKYREDLEWLILSYLVTILSATKRPAPEFAEKLLPPSPDFQTYSAQRECFRQIEITEVLRPGYRRGQFYRELAKTDKRYYQIRDPHPQPWTSFRHVLQSKLTKPYPHNSWLLIYHDMSASEFKDFTPWHERVLGELRSWTQDSDHMCDITASRFESIYVVDASGEGALRLHPHWDVIRQSPYPFPT
jgi:hypothetical protein